MIKNKEKGFALILSIILLIVMSLMGGSLIVISLEITKAIITAININKHFVAETGLIEGRNGFWTIVWDIG